MESSIKYRGDVSLKIKDGRNGKVYQYHNRGTKYMFQIICNRLSSPASSNSYISALNAVAITISDQSLPLLGSPVKVAAETDGGTTSSDSFSLVCTASISYYDILQDNLANAITDGSEIKLLLTSPYAITEGKENDPQYAFAEMFVDSSLLSSVQMGQQIIIEWTLTFSNEGVN